MRAVDFRVTGRVQGVSFRAFARRSATQHGVRGWCRNTKDGAVEGHAEGEEPAMEAFLADLHQGPEAAEVEAVRIEESGPGGHGAFLILV